ncbi:5-aminoimidazole-4-carboxamide ribonucleotide transformylase [Pseudonocardia sp. N23]|uniref:5-aminoimidazole-4-carboxamide ribonucleotide transformylase n=1 Tax=Pseudonocardia sp. N23 TaxID=1987376 RepID=UPI000BFE99DB|nr:5-aminoimidazole-4-carboxamide ribonucleotide transformylase [Pseudonocardia sp. N23]GAY07172.1 IMP cyclohydrolase [Pseudonocardia sp. N23]
MLLRYGTNPHQQPARAEFVDPARPPLRVLSGRPSYVNMLDALTGWALVREAAAACGAPVAASMKHVSPAGVALEGRVDEVAAETFGLDAASVGPLTSAYVRARDADPRASFGDMIAVSEPVDAELADLVRRLTSDGIIAPGYAPGTVETLAAKKDGRFLVLEADPSVPPPVREAREIGGVRLEQPRDAAPLTAHLLTRSAPALAPRAVTDLLLGLVAMRHTESNAVAYLRDGMALGIGAGQQSRIDCTRLAGSKADNWWLRRHPAVRSMTFVEGVSRTERTNWRLRVVEGDLDHRETAMLSAATRGFTLFTARERASWVGRLDEVAFVSDGAIPFRDNVDQAARHGVRHLAEPGGSTRSSDVAAACREHRITRVPDVPRLFRH